MQSHRTRSRKQGRHRKQTKKRQKRPCTQTENQPKQMTERRMKQREMAIWRPAEPQHTDRSNQHRSCRNEDLAYSQKHRQEDQKTENSHTKKQKTDKEINREEDSQMKNPATDTDTATKDRAHKDLLQAKRMNNTNNRQGLRTTTSRHRKSD